MILLIMQRCTDIELLKRVTVIIEEAEITALYSLCRWINIIYFTNMLHIGTHQ